MNIDRFEQCAARTDLDRTKQVVEKISQTQPNGSWLLHSMIGMSGEVGELSAALQKWLYYDQPLDRANIVEELSDICWYLAQACKAMGVSMEVVLEGNIAKLKRRYPEKYTNEAAKEENRNRGLEIQDLTKAETQALTECVACSSGGKMCENQELPATDAAEFIRVQTGVRTIRVYCPNCGGPLTNKACTIAAEGGRPLTCPNCMNTIDPSTVRCGL